MMSTRSLLTPSGMTARNLTPSWAQARAMAMLVDPLDASTTVERGPSSPPRPARSLDRPEFEVGPAPVRHHRPPVGRGVEPFPVRPAAPARLLLAAERLQLPGDLTVGHGAETTVSSHTGSPASGN